MGRRTPLRTSMASSINSLPLGGGGFVRCVEYGVGTYADSWKTASSISHCILFEPAPPRAVGRTWRRKRAQRPWKKGLVPGMPDVHQVLRNLANLSRRSFFAALPAGSRRELGRREPPGWVEERWALNSDLRRLAMVVWNEERMVACKRA